VENCSLRGKYRSLTYVYVFTFVEPDIGIISKIIAGAIIGTIGCIVAVTLLCKKTNCHIPSCRRLCCCKDALYRKDSTIQDLSSNGRDEINEMSDRYEHTAVYPTGSGTLKPPASYNSIQGKEMISNVCLFVCFMLFYATFNNSSVISWRSVLLVEETGGPRENHRPVASY